MSAFGVCVQPVTATPLRKFHPAWVRLGRQNHRMIWADVCNAACARNVARRSVQVAAPIGWLILEISLQLDPASCKDKTPPTAKAFRRVWSSAEAAPPRARGLLFVANLLRLAFPRSWFVSWRRGQFTRAESTMDAPSSFSMKGQHTRLLTN